MSGPARRKRKRIEEAQKEISEREQERMKVESPSSQRRRRKPSIEESDDGHDLYPYEAVEETSEPKRPTKRLRSTRRAIPEDRKDVEYAEIDPNIGQLPKKIQRIVDDHFFHDLIQAMDKGQALTIVKRSEDTWMLGVGGMIAVDKMTRLSGQEYMDEVTSDEWKLHQEEWAALSAKNKIKVAKAAGAEWEEHSNSRVNLMRCGEAYQNVLNLEKYKSEYKALAARNAIRARK